MSITVTFEATNAKLLWQQIVDYIDAAGATSPSPEVVVNVPEVVKAAKAGLPEAPKYPTPAVKQALNDAGIQESEWDKVPRTGKGARMTQGDVRTYAKANAAGALPAEPQATGLLDDSTPLLTNDLPEVSDPEVQTAGALLKSDSDPIDVTVDTSPGVEAPGYDPLSFELGDPEPRVRTMKEVNSALRAAYAAPKGGHEKCVEILARFKVKSTTDIKEDQYADVIAAAEALL